MSTKEYMNSNLYREAKSIHPDIVVIMFGSNDSNVMEYLGKDAFKKDYCAFIHSFLDAKVILCTPCFAYSQNYGVNPENLMDIVDEIQTIGKEYNLEVVNLYNLTKDHPEWFVSDGIHPNKIGSEKITLEIYNVIK